MKGLIIRDIYCLKKGLLGFVAITAGIIIMALMFILSMKHGNLAVFMAEVQSEQHDMAAFFEAYLKLPVLVTLIIPMALVEGITECFKEDYKAGFFKVLYSMPLTSTQIVGSRYLVFLLYSGASLAASLICACIVSSVSDMAAFSELVGSSISFCAFFMIYMSLVMFLLYFLGAKKADFITLIPFGIFLVAGDIFLANKIGQIPENEFETALITMIEDFTAFLQESYLLLLAAAFLCLFISCAASIKIMEKRRG